MKALQLDFQKAPRTTPWLGLLLTALGVLALVWVIAEQDAARYRAEELSTREEQYALRKRNLEAAQLAAQKQQPANEKVAAILRAQRSQMLPALSVLEQTWQPDVAYTRIDVSVPDRSIKMELEARTLDAVLTLVDTLSAKPAIEKVTLARQGVKLADPYRPVQAAIEVRWREAGQ
ncbi:hypothetical protein N8I74_07270 [Chitiniphilus purpureus]|uniref:PilN domain-containing protein n=1 Tax=Chitiniphilus purpureus TaxID=2981137 RepID=A0ABY6DTJ6_9NEIS|nr:hypothetical protein [Chitiniphilus sp. CD1]UXY16811.1 hypothetical protein N8I74_07270 [Chitiniphilus sp. CD1]